MKGRDREGLPRARHRLQMAGDRPPPHPTNTSHLSTENHPRLCPFVSPALLPNPSRQIALWGQVPHQMGVCAPGMTHQDSQALAVPSSHQLRVPRGHAHQFLRALLSLPTWNQGPSLPCCAQPWMQAEPAHFWLPYMNH